MLKRKIALICDYLVNRFDAQILFLPMDVAENPRDDLTCRAIFDLMEKKQDAFLLEPGLNPSEVSGLIKAMDLVISQRLHALILSCSMNTPMIGIPSTGKHDKCTMFMKDIGQ
jgi:polysaccharide pyruvyl transferase WcaK-like protein